MKKKNVILTLACGIFAASLHATVYDNCMECDDTILDPNDPRSCNFCAHQRQADLENVDTLKGK